MLFVYKLSRETSPHSICLYERGGADPSPAAKPWYGLEPVEQQSRSEGSDATALQLEERTGAWVEEGTSVMSVDLGT